MLLDKYQTNLCSIITASIPEIDYWCHIIRYDTGLDDKGRQTRFAKILMRDVEGEGDKHLHVVTVDTIDWAFQRLMTDDDLDFVTPSFRRRMRALYHMEADPAAIAYTGEDTNQLVQIGLFGKVIYE
jgi:hypothetical protein